MDHRRKKQKENSTNHGYFGQWINEPHTHPFLIVKKIGENLHVKNI
jgi:hypothetical protein